MKSAFKLIGGSAARLAGSGIGPRIAFAPDDEKGGGDPNPEDKGGDDKAKDGGGIADKLSGGLLARKPGETKPADGGQPPADGRPEWLPEKFWDAKTKAGKYEDMGKAYAELETAHGKLKRDKAIGGEVPEKPEGYFPEGLELPKEASNFKAVTADDPGLKSFAKVASKYGIGRELAVNLARDMFVEMNTFATPPLDPEAERAKLGKNADAIIDGVYTWAEAAASSGRLSESDVEIVADLSQYADGVNFLRSMARLSGGDPIPFIPSTGAKAMTLEQWQGEFNEAVKAKDYKRQAELDDLGKGLFGDLPPGVGLQSPVDPSKSRGRK